MMATYSDAPTAIQPRYEVEVKSFARIGNVEVSFTIRGHTADDLVSQFRSIQLAEQERGFDAFMPNQVFELAGKDALLTERKM